MLDQSKKRYEDAFGPESEFIRNKQRHEQIFKSVEQHNQVIRNERSDQEAVRNDQGISF